MRSATGWLINRCGRLLSRADEALIRLYGARGNPLNHTGTLVVVMFCVLFATGLYLLLFYRVGSPWESTARINEQVWTGRWIRSLHRFASGAGVVLILLHALKMFVQRRTWGPRALAWLSGGVLLGLFLISGWTGYVMVWDVQGQVLAMEGARILDTLPILSEPLSRTFVGERELSSAFFFVNLFLHVALPLGLALLFWVHVARLARPRMLPPRRVTRAVVGSLALVSILWPAPVGPRADLLRIPATAPFDLFFSAWLPLSQLLSPESVWIALLAVLLPFALVPRWVRPKEEQRPPAVVDEKLCTGCEQCSLDCPYDAITMIPRTDGREGIIARVDPGLCVSCGICSGSCAPMVVGPPGRTGREQLAGVKAAISARGDAIGDITIIACTGGAGGIASMERFAGASVMAVDCVGSLHSSVIEFLLRGGSEGVMVVSCPMDDCRNREGAKWVQARMYHDREAELQERVDRRRVRLVEAASRQREFVRVQLEAFRDALAPLSIPEEETFDIFAQCEKAETEPES